MELTQDSGQESRWVKYPSDISVFLCLERRIMKNTKVKSFFTIICLCIIIIADLYAANLFTIVKSEADMTAVFYMCQLTPLHTKVATT